MCLFLEINIIEISWKVVRKSWHWSWLGDIRPFSSIFRALGRSRHPLYMVKVNCIQLIEHVGNNLDYVGSHVLIGVPQDCLVAPFRMSIYIYIYNIYIYIYACIIWVHFKTMVECFQNGCFLVCHRHSPAIFHWLPRHDSLNKADTTRNILEPKWPVLL